MCPVCIGSALLALAGASSAGGLVLIAVRAVAGGPARHGDDSGNLDAPVDYGPRAGSARGRDEEPKRQ